MRFLPGHVKNTSAPGLLRRLLPCALLCYACWSGSAISAQTGPNALTVFTEVRNTPVLSFNAEGEPEIDNPATALVEALLSEADIAYRINVLPRARLQIHAAREANALAYPVARTPDREDDYEWIGLIRPLQMNLYGLRERAEDLPTTLEDAANFRIGSLRGDVVDTYLRQQGFQNLININSSSLRVELLRRQRFDLTPFAAHGVGPYLHEHNYSIDTLVPVINLPHVTDGLYITMSKSSNPSLAAQLRQAYHSLVDSGIYKEIMGFDAPDN